MSHNGITSKKGILKHLVNWNKMQVDGETMEYMVAIAIELYEAKANLE